MWKAVAERGWEKEILNSQNYLPRKSELWTTRPAVEEAEDEVEEAYPDAGVVVVDQESLWMLMIRSV